MMTTSAKYMKKFTAAALAVISLSMPLASVASASERHDNPPPRQEDRYDKHDNNKHNDKRDNDRYDKQHNNDRYNKHDNDRRNDKNYKYDHRYNKKNSSSYVTKSSSNNKAVASFLIGAAIGAVVAKNT